MRAGAAIGASIPVPDGDDGTGGFSSVGITLVDDSDDGKVDIDDSADSQLRIRPDTASNSTPATVAYASTDDTTDATGD